jgi:hypothetical protein
VSFFSSQNLSVVSKVIISNPLATPASSEPVAQTPAKETAQENSERQSEVRVPLSNNLLQEIVDGIEHDPEAKIKLVKIMLQKRH